MKLSIVCLVTVLLVASLYVDDSEAWRLRFRGRRFFRRVGRAVRRVAPILCPFACRRVCHLPGFCSPVCGKICSRVGKRDVEFQNSKPFPANFAEYDSDKSGHISLEEFAKAIESDKDKSAPAFDLADDNSDGKLDEKELDAAPFITDNDVPELDDSGIDFNEEDLEDLLSEE